MDLSVAQKLWLLRVRVASVVLPRRSAQWAEEIFLTPQRVQRPDSERLWFDNARKKTLSGGIASYEWGPEAGPIVLLVHGWSGRGTQLGAFAEVLVKRGYRVVAIDGPAHGASLGEQTNVGQFSNCLVQVQKELGPFEAVVAHSFGAGCSVLAVIKGMQAKKLVLIAGPSHYEKVIQNFLRMLKMTEKAERFFYESLERKVGMKASDMNVGALGHEVLKDHLRVMVVHDRDDKEVPFSAAMAIQTAWPEVQVFETMGLGHRRILKNPEVALKVAQFISEEASEALQ